MTVLHTGSTQQFSDNWERIFRRGKQSGAALTIKPSAKKSGKRAAAKPVTAKKAGKKTGKKSGRGKR